MLWHRFCLNKYWWKHIENYERWNEAIELLVLSKIKDFNLSVIKIRRCFIEINRLKWQAFRWREHFFNVQTLVSFEALFFYYYKFKELQIMTKNHILFKRTHPSANGAKETNTRCFFPWMTTHHITSDRKQSIKNCSALHLKESVKSNFSIISVYTVHLNWFCTWCYRGQSHSFILSYVRSTIVFIYCPCCF